MFPTSSDMFINLLLNAFKKSFKKTSSLLRAKTFYIIIIGLGVSNIPQVVCHSL